MNIIKQSSTKYALIMSGLLVLCLIYMEITGQSFTGKSPIFPILMFVGSFVLWFLGIKEKKNQLGGKLSYKQGLLEGIKISLIFSIISPFIFLIYYFISPELIEYVKTTYNMQNQSNALIIFIDMIIQFISSFMLGTIFAAIIPLFLKTRN